MGVSLGGINVGHPETNYEKLMSKTFSLATEWLEKHATKSNVVVLAPCGSSRAELLRHLLLNKQYFSKAYVYRGFKEKLEYPGQEVEEYESIDEVVDKLRNKAGKPLAVVPESSFDAVVLKHGLKQVLPNVRVELLYLPALYSRATKELNWPSKDVKKLARVEHTWLGKAYKHRAKGYSSTLLRDWSPKELEELKKAKEAILALSPGKIGLKDYLAETVDKMMIAFVTAPLGAPVALAVGQLLGPLASLNLREAAQKLLEKVGEVPAEGAEEFASRLLEGWTRPEARNIVAAGLARLVISARKATSYLHREELETVVDQVALEWGMDDATFKVFVKNLAKLASGEVITREELRKELEKLGGKEFEERLKRLIEKRLSEIEEELNRLRGKVEALEIGVKLFYAHELEAGLLYSNFKVEKGRPVIASQEERGRVEAELVTAGSFEKLAGEVVKRLEGGFVVLEGPKGIGKSTLAAYTAWLALSRGHADAILYVYKLDAGEASRLENLVKNTGKRFLVLYDPSPLHAYYKPGAFAGEMREATNTEVAKNTLQELLELARSETRVLVLAVLPSDLYNQLYEGLSPQLRESLKTHTLPIDLRDHCFLEEIIKAYSGCHRDFKELAKNIAMFEGGYTLIAKYAGLTLRNKGCRIGEVWKIVEEAKGKPKLFLAYYLWSILLKGNEDLARRVAVPLLLHAAFGPIPEGITYLTAASRQQPWRFLEPSEIEEKRFTLQDLGDEELEPVAKWLSIPHEDLIEETLSELCGFKDEEAKKTYAQYIPKLAGYQQGPGGEQDVLEWALNKIVSETSRTGVNNQKEALLLFFGERLAAVLKAYAPACWRRLALIAGFALTSFYPISLETMKPCLLTSESLKHCELDSYLLVRDTEALISPLVVKVMLQMPSVFTQPLAYYHKEAAEEIKCLEENWHREGYAYLNELYYGLGLALAVVGAAELGESAESWEAELALHVASHAVRYTLNVKSPIVILNLFSGLKELAPHYYILLVSGIPVLLLSHERIIREIAESLDAIIKKHWEELKRNEWSLVEAIHVYYKIRIQDPLYFRVPKNRLEELICTLLNELEDQLRDIAETYTLRLELYYYMKLCSSGDPASRAERLLKRLKEMEKEKPNKQATEWAILRAFRPENFNQLVKELRESLAFLLARYKMKNDDLEVARELFLESAKTARELENYERYLESYKWAERCRVLSAESLDELRIRAKVFEDLRSKAKKYMRQELQELSFVTETFALEEYLVFLALEKRIDEVSNLLNKWESLLRFFPHVNVVLRLLLMLFGVKLQRLEPREVAEVLKIGSDATFWPALNILIGLPGNAREECDKLRDEEKENCRMIVNAISGDEYETVNLKTWSQKKLRERFTNLQERNLVQDHEELAVVERFYRELRDFIDKRDASTVVQLWAPKNPLASFTLMLWALANGDEGLARAHAKLAWMRYDNRLPRRLFREAAEARSEEELKLALLKLFYYLI